MSLPALKFLISKGADLDSPGRYKETPLQTCWNMPNWEAFNALLQAGANPNSHGTVRGAQLLRWTIMANNAEATEKLLKAGADPTAPTCRDTSVIDEAHAEGRNPVITAMIDRRVQQLSAKRDVEAAIKEMTAGTSAAISVKPIRLKLNT
jgi:ankyrin repeat protein